MLDQQNHATGGANSSIMVGMIVCLCLACKKPSEREFFVPAGTDLGVKLLNRCFEASVQKTRNRPSTQLIGAMSCIEMLNVTIKAEDLSYLSSYQMVTKDKNR
jgi:hypothetical protein